MKKVSLSGSPRENVGKKDAATLRKTGSIPGVLYGGDNQLNFQVNAIAMEKIVYSPDVYQVNLELEGNVHTCIIKEIQYHPVTDKIIHFDLLEVVVTKPIIIGLPVRVSGQSEGILNGGALSMNFRKLNVKGLIKDIPESIEVDITPLKIGDKIRAGEVSIPGVEVVQNDSSVVVAVRKTRAAMSADGTLEGEEGEEGAEGEGTEEGAEETAAE